MENDLFPLSLPRDTFPGQVLFTNDDKGRRDGSSGEKTVPGQQDGVNMNILLCK